MGWLAAFALFMLMGALLQRGFAGDRAAPVAVGVRLSQDESAAKLVFDLSRSVDATASALAGRTSADAESMTFPRTGQPPLADGTAHHVSPGARGCSGECARSAKARYVG